MQSSPTRSRGISPWFIMALLAPIYFLTIFYRMTPSTLAEALVADLNISLGVLSMISSTTFITYGLMQLPSGMLVDALGGRRSICVITLMAVAGTVLFAMSSSVYPAIAARLLTGIGCAAVVPCLAILAQYCPANQFSRVNGVLLAIGLGGTVFAGTPLALAAETIGWRACLLICAAVDVALIGAVWFLLQEQPVGVNFSSNSSPRPSLRQQCAEMMIALLHVLREPRFWPYCIWIGCNVGLYFALCGMWWGPWMREGLNLSLEESASVASIAFLCMLPWNPLAGVFSDLFCTRKKVLIIASILAFIFSLLPPLLGPEMSRTMLYVHAIGFAIFTCNVSSVVYAAVRELFPLRMVGTALGCVQTMPFLIFTPLIQNIFSIVLNWRTAATDSVVTGYAEAMWFSPIIIGVSLFATLYMYETYGNKAEAHKSPLQTRSETA